MFTSGTADGRAAAFTRAWVDPSVAALVAVRGGYGSVHLLPMLDGSRLRETPKLFIGYSDNTSLLSWLTCQCGITALHGPMVEGCLARGVEGYDEMSLLRLMQGKGAGLDLQPDGLSTVKAGRAEGPLFGGTLTQLTGSLGTPFPIRPAGRSRFCLSRMSTSVRIESIA